MTWTIAGNTVEPTLDVELTASTLSVRFEIDDDDLSTWEALGDRAGDLVVETGFGGAFRTLARGTAGAITVDPAASESPPIATADWYIDGFDAEPLGPERYEVALQLQRPTPRRDAFTLTAGDVSSASGGDEGFGRNFGRDFGLSDPDGPDLPLYLGLRGGGGLSLVLASRQVGPVVRDGSPHGATVSLSLLLSAAQAAALVDAAGVPAGVVERSVPDDDSVRADESSGRQTLAVTADAGVDITDGDWLLTDWRLQLSGYSPRRWRAELQLAETTRP